jgi:hypothetical protein
MNILKKKKTGEPIIHTRTRYVKKENMSCQKKENKYINRSEIL